MRKILAILSAISLLFCGCATCQKDAASSSTQQKLTKNMFYKNGKFDKEAAKKAYFEMMENLGYPISENLRQNMWVTDFELGDFPNVGMGGIFWAHENVNGVFLLPNQILIEHRHVAGNGLPAKNECWQARAGSAYCFGEKGEDASKYPQVKVPESQKNFVTVHNVTPINAKSGNIAWLSSLESSHYMIGGPDGACVTEYGAFHSNDNNRYTNPKVGF